jgi:hypothetical protein
LIDQLKPEQLPHIVTLLQSMVTAPDDDEPLTGEDVQRLRDVHAALARGDKGMPMEEFMAELGITIEDLAANK